MVVPPSGVTIAFKKSAREARSTIGVPMIPMEPTSVQKRSGSGTGAPTFRCQITVPFVAFSAYTLFDSVAPNDHWAVWTALDVKRLRVNIAYNRAVEV